MTPTDSWRGDTHRVLPRFYQRNLQVAAVRRRPRPAAAAAPATEPVNSFIGREGELRGIPVIGRGVGGAIAGTDPFRAAAARRRRRQEEDQQ